MKILYYSWNEYCTDDIIDCFKTMGYSFECFKMEIKDKLRDSVFSDALKKKIESGVYDYIFTFNYYPVISNTAQKLNVKYISWVFDSPHFTLYTKSIFNSCNYIFLFDRNEALYLQNYGVKNVHHMPLAVNVARVGEQLEKQERSYINEVEFMGTLYKDQYFFFDQIKHMPEYCRGFFDGIIRGQMNLYGYDLAKELITEEFFSKECSFVSFNLDRDIFIPDKDIFVEFLKKKITVVERGEILQLIAEYFPVTHYAEVKSEELQNVNYGGYVDYYKDMPSMFYNSKINLNITLRSITSGIPLRCLDIMGAGGFLLSNWQSELNEFFENGRELVLYDSREDMLDKIEYYLSHDKEREEVAMMGRKKIIEEFSYEKQFNRIEKKVTSLLLESNH